MGITIDLQCYGSRNVLLKYTFHTKQRMLSSSSGSLILHKFSGNWKKATIRARQRLLPIPQHESQRNSRAILSEIYLPSRSLIQDQLLLPMRICGYIKIAQSLRTIRDHASTYTHDVRRINKPRVSVEKQTAFKVIS